MVSPVNVVEPAKTKREGPSLRTVLLSLSFVAVAMGVFTYYRYITSEKAIMAGMAELVKGATLTSEGCVDTRAHWHKRCDALSVMCNDASLHMTLSASQRLCHSTQVSTQPSLVRVAPLTSSSAIPA